MLSNSELIVMLNQASTDRLELAKLLNISDEELKYIIVRPKDDGRYEMISGHRRLRATELAEQNKIKAVVCDYDDDTAAIVMVESNIHQRENMLPSEKAYAYKLLYDAMKHQGKSKKPTSSPVETKLRTDEELAYQLGESRIQIQRFMRLLSFIKKQKNKAPIWDFVYSLKGICTANPFLLFIFANGFSCLKD